MNSTWESIFKTSIILFAGLSLLIDYLPAKKGKINKNKWR
jgi:hypothetical protein